MIPELFGFESCVWAGCCITYYVNKKLGVEKRRVPDFSIEAESYRMLIRPCFLKLMQNIWDIVSIFTPWVYILRKWIQWSPIYQKTLCKFMRLKPCFMSVVFKPQGSRFLAHSRWCINASLWCQNWNFLYLTITTNQYVQSYG